MPVFEDWLNDPLTIVNNIFASDPVNFDQKVNEYFEDKLKSEKIYYSIPCLNDVQIHELKPNCLVRYRCMIQDSFDPIYYGSIQKLKNKTTNETMQVTFKYKEHLDIPEGFEDVSQEEQSNNGVTLKPGDTLEDAMDFHFSNKNQVDLQQRMTFYCVPIPGEADWVKNAYKSNITVSSINFLGSSSNTSHRPSKRGIDTEHTDDAVTDSCLSEVTNNQATSDEPKMTNIDGVLTTTNPQGLEKCKTCSKLKSSQKNNSAKKTKIEECGDTKLNSKNVNHLNFPLSSNETGHACLVKLYEHFDTFKINDMVEFIGILSQEPSLAYEHDEHTDTHHHNFQMSEKLMSNVTLEENSMETDDSKTDDTCGCDDAEKMRQNLQVLSSFPPSLVPRLHCIRSRHLIHNNPILNKDRSDMEHTSKDAYWKAQHKLFMSGLLEPKTPLGSESELLENSKIHMLNLRNELIASFQEMLLGDALAAEYLLMHLLSTVFMRQDITVLGKLSLNLIGIPLPVVTSFNDENKEANHTLSFADSFYKALSQFVPMCHKLHLTIDNLNKSNMIPCKDYDKNKLITGMLQLPSNFQLVLDETRLNAGELNAKGLMNFNSIKDIISMQKLNYDFNYHHQEFPTNIRVLTLSETKSILPADCVLKIQPTVERFDATAYENVIFNLLNQKDSNLVKNFRSYLTILSNQDYKIPDHVQKIVEDNIVNLRKDFAASSSNKNKSVDKSKTLDIDSIHLILIVARLQCLSYGQCELTLDQWNRAKTLEFERLHNRV